MRGAGENQLLDRWEKSQRRSCERREAERAARRVRRTRGAVGAVVVAFSLCTAVLLVQRGRTDEEAGALAHAASARAERPATVPDRVQAAARYARARGGLVSFAVIDSRGLTRGLSLDRPFVSASVVKALLLAAELRRLETAHAPLDELTRTLLSRMITHSDNASADAIYRRVGDAGLHRVARRAGMRSFGVSGYWGNARVTARDLARFLWTLDDLLPVRTRRFGLTVLERVVREQRWGIPAAAGPAWTVRFKGGWRSTERGRLAHQAAQLRDHRGSRIAIAVLTDGQPGHGHATETVRGVAERLLR
jgi:beta-lactamase class A